MKQSQTKESHTKGDPPKTKASMFARFSGWVARAAGSSGTFAVAVLVIIGWAASGPLFHFSDTWQLVINTGTTIVTFLMVFLIQNTQNRDGAAVQAKLDELIRATRMASNAVLDLENVDDKTLTRLREHYRKLAERAPEDINALLDRYETHISEHNHSRGARGGRPHAAGDVPPEEASRTEDAPPVESARASTPP